MYELTCPSCEQLTRHAFVRTGAVTRCTRCDHVYRIGSTHMNGPIRPEQAQPPSPAQMLADPPDDDPKGGSSITGLSGLSQLMQAEPTVSAAQIVASTRSAPDEVAESLSEIPQVSGQDDGRGANRARAERYVKQRRLKRIALLTVAALALLVGVVGVGLMLANVFVSDEDTPEPNGTYDTGGEQTETPDPVEPAPKTGLRPIPQPEPVIDDTDEPAMEEATLQDDLAEPEAAMTDSASIEAEGPVLKPGPDGEPEAY